MQEMRLSKPLPFAYWIQARTVLGRSERCSQIVFGFGRVVNYSKVVFRIKAFSLARKHQRASIAPSPVNVRFSNRPFGVKHFQTIHHYGVDVAHGLVLLLGIGTKALPSWDSRTRWTNLFRGLAVRPTAGSSGHANSPHPSSREGHHSTTGWISSFLLLQLILHGTHAATTSRVHRNSVPSTQMRCMITAKRRASATIAFFMPRRLAICIAQALSQDHFFDHSMLWAAS